MTATTSIHAPSLTAPASSPGIRLRRNSRGRLLLLACGGLAALAVLGVVALLLSFRMGGEARALRQAVLASDATPWKPEFEFGVGRLPAWLARTAFRLTESKLNLPPEASAGIAAFRSADIGVYRRATGSSSACSIPDMARMDATMLARGWEPIVSVQDGDESVRVFMPHSMASHRDTRVCVLVMERDEMVIVSGHLDLEPLVGVVQRHLARLRFPG